MRNLLLPDWIRVPRSRLGRGTGVKVRILGDMDSLARDMARRMADEIQRNNRAGRRTVWIVPVGPVGQYPLLADIINREHIATRDVFFIHMDEYCDARGRLIPRDHPLSLYGFMDRLFYSRLRRPFRFRPEQQIRPHPQHPEEIQRRIDQLGGVDAAWGGVGINGHFAFNEPPEEEARGKGKPGRGRMTAEEFLNLPTRVLALTRETRTINSVTTGGAIAVIPPCAVTVGMREIFAARRIEVYFNRPWQSGVVREVLHGPVTPRRPVSLLRRHPNVTFTLADYVAEKPDVRLR
ncbi:MAG: glucosamine-6-phosphate isomerase [Verrucomicrobiae bacterium]|nr:glucosamine-6-phosphate isomerase [Verrucomicrobiae bacterium]